MFGSRGSSTPTRYGTGDDPGHAFWMLSVSPPEVEKKKAVIGRPPYSAITPAVACTAAVLPGCSPPEPS